MGERVNMPPPAEQESKNKRQGGEASLAVTVLVLHIGSLRKYERDELD